MLHIGCITCKNKRLKCDETKPTCQQCAKRAVTCGGYKKDFKWRPFEEPSCPGKQPTKLRRGALVTTLPQNILISWQRTRSRPLYQHPLAVMSRWPSSSRTMASTVQRSTSSTHLRKLPSPSPTVCQSRHRSSTTHIRWSTPRTPSHSPRHI